MAERGNSAGKANEAAMNCQKKQDSEMPNKQVYMNRELSWLKFNERVLEEAEDSRNPLCERLTFAAIYQTNLDEFFRVRVGALIDRDQVDPQQRENKTQMTSGEQIDAILDQVRQQSVRKGYAYRRLMEELKQEHVRLVNFNMLTDEESGYLEQYFDTEIAPLISPILLGKNAPFPFLKNKDIYAAVLLVSRSGKERIGIIPCSNNVFQRLIRIPSHPGSYMLSEELILHFASKIYRKYIVKSKTLIRVTRNADIDAASLYDEDLADYREIMVEVIKRRRKLSPLRLELSRGVDEEVVKTLCRNLELDKKFVFQSETPLDLSFLFLIQDDLRHSSSLFYERRVPQPSALFDFKRSTLEQIREKDRMLSFPFESMKPFLMMLHEAAEDASVVSIKMTLYRVARDSKVVEALVEAAENGKEVIVLVELRARFDEENNIEWSRKLEDAGCRVIYGLDNYKVHSKLCLITRKYQGGIEYITQIGTGNYNEKTSAIYTDLMVMTADPLIGQEASEVFQALSLQDVVSHTGQLLVAPKCLQNQVLAMIDEEIDHAKHGEPAYIGLKLNSLTDKAIIDKLIEASQAGVQIDMVIRGICCLIPGVEKYTENIHVTSIVGRYLEHSRIYIFGTGEREKLYIASADFMTRNTVKRVEIAIPVKDEDLKLRIHEMFVTILADNCKARVLGADGIYRRASIEGNALNSQEAFFDQAYENAARGDFFAKK